MLTRKLGVIELTKEKIKIEDIPLSLRKRYLGGRGLNVWYLYKYLKRGVDALSPDNIFVIGTGFLTGTLAPSSSRFNVSAKSPETGFLGDSNCGGYFGAELRYSGFDTLILRGRAKKPSYIFVNDGEIELRDASGYWGMDTIEVQRAIKADLGDCEVVTCGVAGEKLVRFANIRTGMKNSGGRCGLGAVMGSKNVKAVVASGSIGIKLAAPDKMLEKVLELKEYLLNSKIIQLLGRLGTPLLYEYSNIIGAIRTKNSQLNAWSTSLNAEQFEKMAEKMVACSSCMVHCRHRNKLGGEGPEYTAVGLLGANLGIEKPEEVIELSNICNKLGLDISSTGTILAWAFELYEKGIIDEKITHEKLEFGNFELIKSMLYKISMRNGFGNILAESTNATKYFGSRSKDYLIAVKNLPQSDPHDVRYIKAFALGIATASRGADHLRSRPTLEIFFKLPHRVKERIYGRNISPEPTSFKGKEKAVVFSENIYAVIDSLGLCKFICHGFNSPHLLGYEHFKDLIYYSSGLRFTKRELVTVGKRVIDIERLINAREGITREDDTLPRRYFEETMKLGVAKGHRIDRKEFELALTKYYKLRGWTENGAVPRKRAEELIKL
ncbi:MAG: aldehyde ferredoxin oxidoreductase family protein [Candidatus Thermoplasmatota archaeon]|nr:aldehyde ferredoxin oxidoreductase family protein [Candidatus Thermoplasmatota archaeon]